MRPSSFRQNWGRPAAEFCRGWLAVRDVVRAMGSAQIAPKLSSDYQKGGKGVSIDAETAGISLSSRLRIRLEIDFDLQFRPSRSEKYQKQDQHRKNHLRSSFLHHDLQPRSFKAGFCILCGAQMHLLCKLRFMQGGQIPRLLRGMRTERYYPWRIEGLDFSRPNLRGQS